MRIEFACSLAISALLAISGCGKETPPAAPPANGADDHAHGDHDHSDEGPHHGQLIELGDEEYHAELTHDDQSHTVTIYLLDNNARKAVTTEEPEVTLNLVIDGEPAQFKLPAAADAETKGSQFSLVDQRLGKALDAGGVMVRLNVTIDDKPYAGSVEHVPHGDDHEDEHGHEEK